MGFLLGGGSQPSNDQPALGALSIQTSAYGLAIPLCYGKNRLTGNLVWYSDFTAIPHTSSQSSGGKGGPSAPSSTTYTYTTALIMGLAEGPGNAIGTVWADKAVTTAAALGLTFFAGSYPQATWGYLTTNHPTQALAYSGLSYVANGALDLGSNGSLPNLSFELTARLPYGGAISDANPSDIVYDYLSNANYGVGFAASKIASLTQFSNYCVANNIFLSPFLTDQSDAASHLTDILMQCNTAPVWSEGVLKFIPYGDTAATANAVTYTPSITPAYDLTDSDFLDNGSDGPIECTRKQNSDAYNHVQIEFKNRANSYNNEIAEAKDQANIDQYGLRTQSPIAMHGITTGAVAATLAQIILQRSLYIRNIYKFKLGWKYALLEPMDIVTLTDSRLGLNRAQVRITETEENETGEITITAEEFPFGVATPASFNTQGSSGYSTNFNVAPGNSNTPVIFEPPISLAGNPEIWLATSGGQDWGGAEVWVSTDNATYKMVGIISGRARHGTLTANLASAGDPDTTSTLAVDLSVSNGSLISGTLADRDAYNTLCYVDGELVSYQTATLTAANRYNLTSLRRGAYGTVIGVHTSTKKFARLDQAIFKYAYNPVLIGSPLYIKLRSYNIYGGAAQDLSTVTANTYNIVGAPLGSVSGLVLEQPFVGVSAKIKWTDYPGAASYTVAVYVAGVLKRTVTDLVTPRYEYTFEDAKADGGPFRSPEFRVTAVARNGQSSSATVLATSNPQQATPGGIILSGAGSSLSISCNLATDSDYSGTLFWVSTTTGFNPLITAPVYDGPNNFFTSIGLIGGTTYYVRVAQYDVFGKDSLNISSESSVAIVGMNGGIDVVASLPTTGLTDGRVVLLSTDHKLYRYNTTTTVWSTAVDGSDLLASSVTASKITAANLAAISANLGAVTAGTFTLDATGFIRGGQTAYNTGAGFWLGYDTGAYKFSLGNSAGNNLTWDGTTLTIKGALNAATGTFAGSLSAATGTFAGSLSAASGSFAGSLSAATGTFSGSLTASAINAVDTINIAGNAVTIPVSSFTASTSFLYTGSETTIQTASITSIGGMVSISLSFQTTTSSITPSNSYSNLRRDGVLVCAAPMDIQAAGTVSMFSFNFAESPGAGAHTYTLTMSSLTSPEYYYPVNVAIILLETKR